tara:strand:- start:106 stop:297 length:192 start_codon:yes stop_codon:yes gene_type:complete
MDSKHPDAAAVERVGMRAIMAHFGISRQAVWSWKRKGVPVRHRKTLALLGAAAGHDMPEMRDG